MLDRILSSYRAADERTRRSGLAWYSTASRQVGAMARRHGVAHEAAAGVVSAVSPLCPWSENLARAERVVRWHAEGRGGPMPSVTFSKNCRKASDILLAGTGEGFFAPDSKTESFFLNLSGRHDAVTLDTWMLRHARMKQSSLRGPIYSRLADEYRQSARVLGVRPSGVQAVIWLMVRKQWRGKK